MRKQTLVDKDDGLDKIYLKDGSTKNTCYISVQD